MNFQNFHIFLCVHLHIWQNWYKSEFYSQCLKIISKSLILQHCERNEPRLLPKLLDFAPVTNYVARFAFYNVVK